MTGNRPWVQILPAPPKNVPCEEQEGLFKSIADFGWLAQLVRALVSATEGRRFESGTIRFQQSFPQGRTAKDAGFAWPLGTGQELPPSENKHYADMTELADVWDLKSHGLSRAGSSPAVGTMIQLVRWLHTAVQRATSVQVRAAGL